MMIHQPPSFEAPSIDSPIHPSVPRQAAVWDALLGGRDNLAADRELAAALTAVVPALPGLCARLHDRALAVVADFARAGVRQFLDIGCGMPTDHRATVHGTALAAASGGTVIYVDRDPVAVSHRRARSGTRDGTVEAVLADIRNPYTLLDHYVLDRCLDPAAPVAVCLFSVLHAVDDHTAATLIDTVTARLPVGSRLAVVDITTDGAPALLARIRQVVHTHTGDLPPDHYPVPHYRSTATTLGWLPPGWTLDAASREHSAGPAGTVVTATKTVAGR